MLEVEERMCGIETFSQDGEHLRIYVEVRSSVSMQLNFLRGAFESRP
jgi:hypothetical protein